MTTLSSLEFTGHILPDLVHLAHAFDGELDVIANRPDCLLDRCSFGANDGQVVRVVPPGKALRDLGAEDFGEFRAPALALALDEIADEVGLAEDGARDPAHLAGLDARVLDACREAAMGDVHVDLLTGTHAAMAGTPDAPVWSLVILNDPIRRLVCSKGGEAAFDELFLRRHTDDDATRMLFMAELDHDMPLAAFLSRRIRQLQAQCLDPDVLLLKHVGLVVKATSARRLWQVYTHVVEQIVKLSRQRQKDVSNPYGGRAELINPTFIPEASRYVYSAMGKVPHLEAWRTSREAGFRHVLCSQEALRTLGQGFPDESLIHYAGVAPLVVEVSEKANAQELGRAIHTAWETYKRRFSGVDGLLSDGTTYLPRVIIMQHLCVFTLGADEADAETAYAGLLQAASVMDNTRAFGGMVALPMERARYLCNSTVTRNHLSVPPAADDTFMGDL